jgi:hypothetical protein
MGEKARIKSVEELYGKKTKGLILRLMKRNVDDPLTASVVEDCDCSCSFNFSGRPVRQVKISLSSDSNQIAIYYKEHRTIRIFSIDSSKPAKEAFADTFANIEGEENYVEHTISDKSGCFLSPISKLWFEPSKQWMLIMNDNEIEVIDYSREPDFDPKIPQVVVNNNN